MDILNIQISVSAVYCTNRTKVSNKTVTEVTWPNSFYHMHHCFVLSVAIAITFQNIHMHVSIVKSIFTVFACMEAVSTAW